MTEKTPTVDAQLATIVATLDGMVTETDTYRKGHDERHKGMENEIASVKEKQEKNTDAISQQKGIHKMLVVIGGFITFATATAVAIFNTK